MKNLVVGGKSLVVGGFLALIALTVPHADAGRPDAAGGGGGKPGPGGSKVPPNPDIVYMSDNGGSDAVWQSAVRGIEVSEANGLLSFKDVSLLRSKSGRQPQSVAWSPDGTLVAWVELGNGMVSTPVSIIVGGPGRKPVAIYTATPDISPRPLYGEDMLAWGWACGDTDKTTSVLAFSSPMPQSNDMEVHWGIFGIVFEQGVPGAEPVLLWEFKVQVAEGDPSIRYLPHAFAFSPLGKDLIFAGTTEPSGQPEYGLWKLDTCNGSTARISTADTFQPHSIDWDQHGDHNRLVLAITNEDSPDWRNLMIMDVASGNESVIELFTYETGYEGYSSEHSPQWGSAVSGGCERIAFSRSWWDTNPETGVFQRGMYLLDIDGSGTPSCEYSRPERLNATWPRALDWK